MLGSVEVVSSTKSSIQNERLTRKNMIKDLHEYMSGPILVSKKAYAKNGKESPVTLGHECSGIIEEVGENVKGLFKGQRVVVRPTIYDGKCSACKGGNRHCCENIRFIGLSGMLIPLTQPITHQKG